VEQVSAYLNVLWRHLEERDADLLEALDGGKDLDGPTEARLRGVLEVVERAMQRGAP
jgi:hypothetical protein